MTSTTTRSSTRLMRHSHTCVPLPSTLVPSTPGPNAAMAHHWNVEAGPAWVLNEQHLDAMLEPFLARLIDVGRTNDR